MDDKKFRSKLIRVAASLPKGDDSRRKLLAALTKEAVGPHDRAPNPDHRDYWAQKIQPLNQEAAEVWRYFSEQLVHNAVYPFLVDWTTKGLADVVEANLNSHDPGTQAIKEIHKELDVRVAKVLSELKVIASKMAVRMEDMPPMKEV